MIFKVITLNSKRVMITNWEQTSICLLVDPNCDKILLKKSNLIFIYFCSFQSLMKNISAWKNVFFSILIKELIIDDVPYVVSKFSKNEFDKLLMVLKYQMVIQR